MCWGARTSPSKRFYRDRTRREYKHRWNPYRPIYSGSILSIQRLAQSDDCISVGDGTEELHVTRAPSKVKISDVSFKNIRGTSATPVVVKLACSRVASHVRRWSLLTLTLYIADRKAPQKSQCSNVKPKISG
ncbi:hypothetical protein OIU78_022821 [Salix suchowensis]|nr:hypothetical protein OIU78_022821 [Salix suchowensis]